MTSKKHHYIPVFYLKRWKGPDGRLCEFSAPFDKVKPLLKTPQATGWVNRLYQMQGYPEHLAQQIEERFFSPVDSAAADALAMMEARGNHASWTSDSRSAWSRFIVSLLTRCPEDIHILTEKLAQEYRTATEKNEAEYRTILNEFTPEEQSNLPATFQEYLKSRPEKEVSFFIFKILRNIVDSAGVGGFINGMIWHVQELPDGCPDLLTSDRPVAMTNGLRYEKSHIFLAIGPRRIFLATNSPIQIETLKSSKLRQIVLEYNRVIVRAAQKYAYARSDSLLPFVAKHFGKE